VGVPHSVRENHAVHLAGESKRSDRRATLPHGSPDRFGAGTPPIQRIRLGPVGERRTDEIRCRALAKDGTRRRDQDRLRGAGAKVDT
jgi:hypothetical protein